MPMGLHRVNNTEALSLAQDSREPESCRRQTLKSCMQHLTSPKSYHRSHRGNSLKGAWLILKSLLERQRELGLPPGDTGSNKQSLFYLSNTGTGTIKEFEILPLAHWHLGPGPTLQQTSNGQRGAIFLPHYLRPGTSRKSKEDLKKQVSGRQGWGSLWSPVQEFGIFMLNPLKLLRPTIYLLRISSAKFQIPRREMVAQNDSGNLLHVSYLVDPSCE